MNNIVKKNVDTTFSLNHKDRDFSIALEHLLTNKKVGHLGIYHYGEPNREEDTVNGAYLWNRFVKNSTNYYQFSTENKFLPEVAAFVASLTKNASVSLIDMGPGSNTSLQAKTFPFLSSLENIENYIPVDISTEYLQEINKDIATNFPLLDISLQRKNYFTDTINFNVNSVPVFLFLSSNISNLPEINLNGNYEDHLSRILKHFHSCMHRSGYLVISQDCNQDEASLLNAYIDPLHIDFSLNILHRMKRDAIYDDKCSFDPKKWIYKPEWFPEKNLLAHSLYSTTEQTIDVLENTYTIKKGQRFIVDNSYKYKTSDFLRICIQSGFSPIETFMDPTEKIATHVLKTIF
jgi:uncharacterized SAM-dependent methyltransferase